MPCNRSLPESLSLLRLVRLGAEAGRTPCPRGGGQEELPHVQGQKWRPGGATPRPRSGAAAKRSYPASLARGGGREDLPHARGQGRWPEGATPPPRSGGCVGTGGPRGAIPRSRSGGVAVRRYPSSKVRSIREEIPHVQGKRNPSKTVGVARGH